MIVAVATADISTIPNPHPMTTPKKQPKYQIGDEVWVVSWDKVMQRKILAVLYNPHTKCYLYSFAVNNTSLKPEAHIFPTKQSLIDSL